MTPAFEEENKNDENEEAANSEWNCNLDDIHGKQRYDMQGEENLEE